MHGSGCSRIGAILLHLLLLRAASRWWALIAFGVIGASLIASSLTLFGVRFPPVVACPIDPPRSIATPHGLLRLLCAFAILTAILPTLNRLFIFTPAANAPVANIGSWLLAAFYCGVIAGPLAQRHLSAGRTERSVGIMTILPIAVSAILLVTAGSYVAIAAAALHGAALSMIGASLWAEAARIAMTDACGGPRGDGLVASAVILTTHLSTALGALLIAPLIEGYERSDPRAEFGAALLVCAGALAIVPLILRRRTGPATA